jgi:hypothetical protein
MKTVFSIDRIEGDIAVCISDDKHQIDVPVDKLGGMVARDVFSAEFDGDTLRDIVPMPEERDRRLKANLDRLHRLAKRNKP